MRPIPLIALSLVVAASAAAAVACSDGPTQNRAENRATPAQVAPSIGKPGSARVLLSGGRLGRPAPAQSTVCLRYQKQLHAVQVRLRLGSSEALKTRATTLSAKIADVCN